VADWDGAHAVRIAEKTSHAGYRFPRWSPNGRYLTYESWTPDGREATTSVTDTSGRVLSSFPGFWSSWSPDSTKLATWESAIHSVDGAFLTNVAQPEGWSISGDQYAAWTADGNAVILSLIQLSQFESVSAVWAMPVDGGPPRKIVDGYGGFDNHTASPDGTRFAVYDGRRLELVDSSGRRLATIADFTAVQDYLDAFPWGGGDYWSPDGRQIAFGHAGGLNVFDTDTGSVQTVVTTDTSAAPLRWSPDGRIILFVQPNHESSPSAPSPASIWRVGADGSHPTLVVSGTSDGDWQWLPR
jgi:Tol biopolymer transport system component